MAATLDIKAFEWIIPSAAKVTVIDAAFRKRGDVNGDGKIDMDDINRITAAYDSTPDSPNWDPECDLNGDGKIDVFDIVMATSHYLETAPQYTAPFSVQAEAGRVVLKGVLNNLELHYDFTVSEGDRLVVIFAFDPVTGGGVIVIPLPWFIVEQKMRKK